jgi:tetratricopeptide (TPR) repeat protein
MQPPTIPALILLLFLTAGTKTTMAARDLTDTSAINTLTQEAYLNARKSPDSSIRSAHRARAASASFNYLQGKADAYLALGMAYLAKYNPGDSALYYNNQALQLYRELNDNAGQARACYGLSYVHSMKGDLKASEKFGTMSLNLFKEAGDMRGMANAYSVLSYLAKQQKELEKARSLINSAIETARSANDTLPLADAINSLGNIYKDMALFNRATDAYFEALKLWEQTNHSEGIANAYGNIGLVYYYQKDWEKALEFTRKKLPYSEAAGNMWEVSKSYHLLANIYNARGAHDSALNMLRKSLKLNREMNYPPGIATAFNNLASTHLLAGRPDSALACITKTIDIAEQTGDPALSDYYVTLGRVLVANKDYPAALRHTLQAHQTATQKKQPLLLSESAKLLSDIYHLQGRDDLAYRYLQQHRSLQDSISNDEYHNRVTRMEIQYEYDKKERAAEFARMEERMVREHKIKQQGVYLKGLIILIVIGSLFFLLYLRHSRLQNRYTRIDLEQRLLRTQMNPHFIFNSLCAVQDMILSGKPEKANEFLARIARLMRNILENSREEFISLEKEIETVSLYLEVQQLRFESGFSYDITIDPAIDPENYAIPPMLTQPCVENSIEHGLLPGEKSGKINVSYILSNGLMKLEVSDNGVGREQAAKAAEHRTNRRSLATQLTVQRLAYFKKRLRKRGIGFEIIDLYEEERAAGTKVVMMLPYRKIYES